MFALECVCRPSRPGRLLPERRVLAFRRRRWPPRRCILATRRLWGPGASCPSALAQVVVVSDECRPVRFGRLLSERCVQALRRRRWPLRRLNMDSRDAAVLGPWCELPSSALAQVTMRNDDARSGRRTDVEEPLQQRVPRRRELKASGRKVRCDEDDDIISATSSCLLQLLYGSVGPQPRGRQGDLAVRKDTTTEPSTSEGR